MTTQKENRPHGTSHRGFAAMDEERQRQIASMGGKAAHESGHAHEFTSEEARIAGAKGGAASGASRAANKANRLAAEARAREELKAKEAGKDFAKSDKSDLPTVGREEQKTERTLGSRDESIGKGERAMSTDVARDRPMIGQPDMRGIGGTTTNTSRTAGLVGNPSVGSQPQERR